MKLNKKVESKFIKVVCEKCGSHATEKVIAGFSVGQGRSGTDTCSTCYPTGTCGL